MRGAKRRDCGCGCGGSGACGTRKSSQRDALAPPASSRRGERIGYRFATIAALVRGARMRLPEAEQLVDDWSRYVRYRMVQNKSPESTAGHLVRFEAHRLAQPYPARVPSARDPAPPHRPRRPHRQRSSASVGASKEAGKTLVSKRGFPFKACPRGTRPEALMFPKERYDTRSAKAWAHKHGFPIREVEDTKNFIRIRVAPKNLFVKGSFRNIPMSERYHVRMIIGCPRFEVLAGGRSRAPKRTRRTARIAVAADY